MNTKLAPKGRTYVVGDIHGSYKSLIQAIERSPFDPSSDRLITIGDYIDGGSHIEIFPVIEYLNSLPDWIGLIGNHDYWMYEAIDEGWLYGDMLWYHQGGRQTFEALGIQHYVYNENVYFNSPPPQEVGDFLECLHYYYQDHEDNVFVHAGWRQPWQRVEESETVKMGNLKDLFWDRSFWREAESRQAFPHNKVFIGHTSSLLNPRKRGNIWNIDSGATIGGPVTIMDVETEQYWQSEATSALYPNFTMR